MVTVMQPIESNLPLAKAFNIIIEKVQTLRIITLPRTFEDVRGEDASHDGVAFEDLPDDWKCPRCKRPKEKFNRA